MPAAMPAEGKHEDNEDLIAGVEDCNAGCILLERHMRSS
jgi:hypothetical protein